MCPRYKHICFGYYCIFPSRMLTFKAGANQEKLPQKKTALGSKKCLWKISKAFFAFKTQVLFLIICRVGCKRGNIWEHSRNTDFKCFSNVLWFAYLLKICLRHRVCVSQTKKMFLFVPARAPKQHSE